MSHLQYVDELVKDYLLFRGLSQTLRTLDNELKLDKDKGFRVDRLVDQIISYIQTYDLGGLRDLWKHLEGRTFVRLPHNLQPCVRKFETSILRLYVVNTIQTNKPDKLTEFFEKMASELQSHAEWREWFILPYLRVVEDNPTFAMYFTKQWQDTLYVSLHNFLAVVYQNLELPTLAKYHEEASKIARLNEEVESLRVRLSALTSGDFPPDPPPSPPFSQVMDDFYNIAQETPTSEGQLKSLKTLLFGLGGGLPPPPQSSRQVVTTSSQTPQQAPRRAPSCSSSSDKRRPRSSSLAPSSSRNSATEQSSKRIVPNTSSSASRQSRSPIKSHSTQDDSVCSIPSQSQSAFILVGQEDYCEHRSVVSQAVFNPTGTLVASADNEGVVKIWSPSPQPKTHCGVMLKSAVTSVEWLPRGERYLMLATKAANLKLFDTKERKTIWDLNHDNCSILKDQRIMGVKITPNESTAVLSVFPRTRQVATSPSGHASAVLHRLDIKSLKIESSYDMGGAVVNGSSLNHNGGLMVCGCNDGAVKIVDLRCPDIIASWPAHQGEVFTVKLSPQEDLIYTIGSDNRFACWSMAQTGARVLDHSLHDRAAGPFLVSVSSSTSSNSGGSVSSTGGRSVLLRPYGSLFALHQDGQSIFTCSSSGCIIYKIKDGGLEEQMSLHGHKSPVITVDWSNNLQCGTCVAGSIDGRITVSTVMPH